MGNVSAVQAEAAEPTVAERSREILNDLIRDRQRLRADRADEATLEANRLAIVYWQQHLARALIQSNRP